MSMSMSENDEEIAAKVQAFHNTYYGPAADQPSAHGVSVEGNTVTLRNAYGTIARYTFRRDSLGRIRFDPDLT